MDKEKAIDVIRANYPPVGYIQLREALNVAIKSLEKEIELDKAWKEACGSVR